MSPRRPRSGARKPTKPKEDFADEETSEKGKQKKRKLPDLLGPVWTGEELKKFYMAYRRYGKDWKKVAGSLDNRSVEMVEALYAMNKAYLSLQEGFASVAGLIAMMTDHYNMLEESKSVEADSSEDAAAQMKSRMHMMPAGTPNFGEHSPSKRPITEVVNRPRAVGKRTPRVPFMHLQEKKDYVKMATVKVEATDQDSFGDCDEVQVAMTLAANASQKAASPQISRTPTCRTDHLRGSPIQNGSAKEKRVCVDSGGSGSLHTGSNRDEGDNQGSEESKDTENGVVTKACTSAYVGGQRATAAETAGRSRRKTSITEASGRLRKAQKVIAKKVKARRPDSDDLKEECSCTDEGVGKRDDVKWVDGLKVGRMQKKKRQLSQQQTKRRQLFSGEERSGLDALATLADMSLNGMLPSPRLGADANKSAPDMFDWTTREGQTEESYGIVAEMQRVSKKGILVAGPKGCGNAAELDIQNVKSFEGLKTFKRKPSVEKGDFLSESNFDERIDADAQNAQRAALRMSRRNAHLLKQRGSKVTEFMSEYSQDGHLDLDEDNMVDMATTVVGQEGVCGKYAKHEEQRRPCCTHASTAFGLFTDKVRLIHCFSSDKVRRWCTYEWFYNAIDLPWFSRNEFVEYLNHAGLGHVPRLTRAEWGVIRGSLGKPRRLSRRFLQEEREKLEIYRDSVRKHYQEVRMGHCDGLPTDLPRPLTVGQRVAARHPRTTEIYDGSILTVDRNKCRVQFDRPELGVELVCDIDCMPVNTLDNLSDILVRKSIAGSVVLDHESKLSVRPFVTSSSMLKPSSARGEKFGGFNCSSNSILNALCKEAQVADNVDSVSRVKEAANEAVAAAQQSMQNEQNGGLYMQQREMDVRALVDLSKALDKKEAILSELRNMNDEADRNNDAQAPNMGDVFQKHYATLILQLKDVNQQVCGALLHLRQRNKYQDTLLSHWHEPVNQNCTSSDGLLELSPLVREVFMHAKQHAKLMVNTAMEAMYSLKEGEDALVKIGGSLNSLAKFNLQDETRHETVSTGSAVGSLGPLACQWNSAAFLSASDYSNVDYTSKEATTVTSCNLGIASGFPIELMSTCITALLMVQAFTERQYPPAEVAMTLDYILGNLQPCTPQNYHIYTEIQRCANLLKKQVIALIPTHCLPIDCPSTPN